MASGSLGVNLPLIPWFRTLGENLLRTLDVEDKSQAVLRELRAVLRLCTPHRNKSYRTCVRAVREGEILETSSGFDSAVLYTIEF